MNIFTPELIKLGYCVQESSIGMWTVTKKDQEYLIEKVYEPKEGYLSYELISFELTKRGVSFYDDLNPKETSLDDEMEIVNLIEKRYYENCNN